MTSWPPNYEDTFRQETGSAPYHRKILEELRVRRPDFEHLSRREQMDLAEAVWTIDFAASLAARALRRRAWSVEELSGVEPPPSAKSKRKLARWMRERTQQYCINFCSSARTAIFNGNFGKAVHDALYAGQYLNGDVASSGLRSLQGLTSREGPAANKRRAQKIREIVLAEARTMCANNKLSARSAAINITKKHVGQRFVSERTIRQILSNDKSWQG